MHGIFQNRAEAGHRLADALRKLEVVNPLILVLPRGGIVVGVEVARHLKGQLDIILVKKLRAPAQAELAIGAIGEGGIISIDKRIVQSIGVSSQYLEEEQQKRIAELEGQNAIYRKDFPKIDPQGREIILVDDGIATGSTMIAAIQVCSVVNPKKLLIAVPVAPSETIAKIKSLSGITNVICLMQPSDFRGVGQFYKDFEQIPDETVIQILREAKQWNN